MAEEADYTDVSIPLPKGTSEGKMQIGFLPDSEIPLVGMWVPGLGLIMLTPDSARDTARRLLVEADRANRIPPSHIYVVDNRDDLQEYE